MINEAGFSQDIRFTNQAFDSYSLAVYQLITMGQWCRILLSLLRVETCNEIVVLSSRQYRITRYSFLSLHHSVYTRKDSHVRKECNTQGGSVRMVLALICLVKFPSFSRINFSISQIHPAFVLLPHICQRGH